MRRMKAEDVASSPRKFHSINQQEDLNYTVWIRTFYRSHLMTCRDALLFCLYVILLLLGWNLVSSEYSLEFEEYAKPSTSCQGFEDGRVSWVLYISLMILLVHVMSRIHESSKYRIQYQIKSFFLIEINHLRIITILNG